MCLCMQGKTWLRGLQPTDDDGIAQFTTIWPGHYPGRAVHTHVMAHWGGKVSKNHYIGGSRPHIGQVFYDQSVISAVESLVGSTSVLLARDGSAYADSMAVTIYIVPV